VPREGVAAAAFVFGTVQVNTVNLVRANWS
jgi:hypothetical protein